MPQLSCMLALSQLLSIADPKHTESRLGHQLAGKDGIGNLLKATRWL